MENRIFISDSKCRRLLSQYAKTATDNEEMLSFTQSEADDLDKLLALHFLSLHKLFISLNRMVPCPKAYTPLLRSLSTLSPVCALVIPNDETLVLVDLIVHGGNIRSDPNLWSQLQRSIPLFSQLFLDLDVSALPSEMRAVLNEIAVKSKRTFEIPRMEDTSTQCSCDGCDGDSSCYSCYPNLPKVRE